MAVALTPPALAATPGRPEATFLPELIARVVADLHEVRTHNVDRLRFPRTAPLPTRLLRDAADTALVLLHKAGLHFSNPAQRGQVAARLSAIAGQERFNWLHGALADDESRRLLVALLAYRVLGPRHVRLPLNNAEFWRKVASIKGELLTRPRVASVSVLGHLDEYDLSRLGTPVRLQAHPLNILNTFLLEQYRFCRAPAPVIEVTAGDVVIDAGACWGDTALYFAHKAGPQGRVFAYEFLPDNLEILRRNLEMNPELAGRIDVVARAVWSRAGEKLGYAAQGSASRLVAGDACASTATTDTIDALVAREQVPRIDFIKMDIEGAELDALAGAEQAIRRFRPRLAISAYHRLEHLWEIPAFIDALRLGYDLYLDHFTIHAEETVLFAVPRES